MRRTKIIFIVTKSNWGGAQKYVYDLATLLPAAEYDVLVVFGGSGELAHKLSEKEIRTVSVPQLGRDIHLRDDLSVFFSLVSIFFRERPAIIHLNSSKIGGLGALAARVYNAIQRSKRLLTTHHSLPTKIIFTAHGWPFREERPRWQASLIRLASWLTIMLSHVVIVVSERDAEDGRAMFCAKKKIRRVYNGIRSVSFLSRKDARAEIMRGYERVAIPDDAYWVGTNAELTRNKGLGYAIEAMAHLAADGEIKRPPLYVVIGDGELKDALSRTITERGLEKKVFLVGTKKDAARLLLAFDCFLLPSIKEGLPYAILEAGLAKLPVMATQIGGIPEIVSGGESGILIPPKDSRAIAEATASLMNDPGKGERCGVALALAVQKKFSFEDMLAETRRIYESR